MAIENNTTALEELLNTIEALPDGSLFSTANLSLLSGSNIATNTKNLRRILMTINDEENTSVLGSSILGTMILGNP